MYPTFKILLVFKFEIKIYNLSLKFWISILFSLFTDLRLKLHFLVLKFELKREIKYRKDKFRIKKV